MPSWCSLVTGRSKNDAFDEFQRRAQVLVADRIDHACELIRTRGLVNGLWHPNGFATFVLEDIEDFGLLRVHFWPRGLRRSVPHHPQIHQHCFHLYSHVLAGTYRERQLRGAQVPIRIDEIDFSGEV